jgi:hypothetical protein
MAIQFFIIHYSPWVTAEGIQQRDARLPLTSAKL